LLAHQTDGAAVQLPPDFGSHPSALARQQKTHHSCDLEAGSEQTDKVSTPHIFCTPGWVQEIYSFLRN